MDARYVIEFSRRVAGVEHPRGALDGRGDIDRIVIRDEHHTVTVGEPIRVESDRIVLPGLGFDPQPLQLRFQFTASVAFDLEFD